MSRRTQSMTRPITGERSEDASLYERDFYAWTQAQATLLEAGRLGSLDLEHLAEEIEDMGSEQRHAVSSQLRHLLTHLLKLRYSPARYPRRGWIVETQNARDEIAARLATSPSLRTQLPRLLDEEWPRARRAAVLQMDVYGEQADIPRECPFTLEQALDDDYRPG